MGGWSCESGRVIEWSCGRVAMWEGGHVGGWPCERVNRLVHPSEL